MADWMSRFSANYKKQEEIKRQKERTSPRGPMPEVSAGDVASTVGSAVSYPQRKLKEAVSGDESEWFSPEGLPVPVYAAGNTLLDLFADPLVALGAGGAAFKSGAKAVDALTGPNSDKGMLLSSLSNMIMGYYGGNRSGAIAKWAPRNVARMASTLVSPTGRAAYREGGVNPASQAIVKEQIEKTLKASPSDKYSTQHQAVAQMQYNDLIAEQTGREAKTPRASSLEQVREKSYLVPPTDYVKGDYKKLVQEKNLGGTYAESGKAYKVPEKDIDYIEDHFSTVWEEAGVSIKDDPNVKLAIKNPGSGGSLTGRHYNDVLYNAPYVPYLRKLFKDKNKISMDELAEQLKSAAEKSKQKAASADNDSLKFRVKKVDSDGVWITGSRAGSSYTEGGINYLVKIEPNGKMTGIMSDEHNFLEGAAEKIQRKTKNVIPALDKMKEALIYREISVTPPMVTNIRNLDVKSASSKTKTVSPSQTTNKDRYLSKDGTEGMLADFANYRASDAVIREELKKNIGASLMAAGAGSGGYGMLIGGNREKR